MPLAALFLLGVLFRGFLARPAPFRVRLLVFPKDFFCRLGEFIFKFPRVVCRIISGPLDPVLPFLGAPVVAMMDYRLDLIPLISVHDFGGRSSAIGTMSRRLRVGGEEGGVEDIVYFPPSWELEAVCR